jgi:hypothetical protein
MSTLSLPLPRTAAAARRREALWAATAVAGVWVATRTMVEWVAVLANLHAAPDTLRHPGAFFTLLLHWDGLNYAFIAQHGYEYFGFPSYYEAFLPGYPFLSRFVADGVFLTGHPDAAQIAVAMWAVTNLATGVAAVLLWFLVRDRFGRAVAYGASALMMLGPYAHFLVASYPESLFLALAIGAWFAMSRQRWVLAAMLTAFSGLVRVEALYLAAALALLLLIQAKQWTMLGRLWRSAVFTAVGVSGLLSYFGWLWARTADPFYWFDIEKWGWDRTTQWPWQTFADTLAIVGFTRTSGRYQEISDLVMVGVSLLALGVLACRRWWPELVYTGLMLVSMGTSHAYTSIARESTVQFPLVILVASSLASRRWRWVFWLTLALAVTDLVYQTRQFSLGAWGD